MHRSVTINIQGESYRLRQHRKAGLPTASDQPKENKADCEPDESVQPSPIILSKEKPGLTPTALRMKCV